MTSDLPEAELADWLRTALPDCGSLRAVRRLPGGQSNPTYRLTTDQCDLVLRRKPFGDLLASAHAVDREYRVIGALHPVGFPVPRPMVLCQDRNVIGAEFYVMETIDGRTHWIGSLPDCTPAERRSTYEAAVTTLATLHSVDPGKVGLADFGAPGSYLERQVRRWTRQYRAAQTDQIDEVEKLIQWLPLSLPRQDRVRLVHGDYRLDNLLFAKTSASVLAVIDWELATVGDPLADLSYFGMAWHLSSRWHPAWFGDLDITRSGIPTLDEMIGLYCEVARRPDRPVLEWYNAFNLFRAIGITQGIKRRMLDGNASSEKAAKAIEALQPLAVEAWSAARRAGAA